MRKIFHIPLLTALPTLLTGCQHEPNISQYQRVTYNSFAQCMEAYRPQILQGLQNPCYQSRVSVGGGFVYYGPYIYNGGGTTRYLGYNSSGQPASTGLLFNQKGVGRSFTISTRRGGFSSSHRSRGFGG